MRHTIDPEASETRHPEVDKATHPPLPFGRVFGSFCRIVESHSSASDLVGSNPWIRFHALGLGDTVEDQIQHEAKPEFIGHASQRAYLLLGASGHFKVWIELLERTRHKHAGAIAPSEQWCAQDSIEAEGCHVFE
nr:hypothetical protein [Sinorhizobium psoraleae]